MHLPSQRRTAFAGIALLSLTGVVLAHSHDEKDMVMKMGQPPPALPTTIPSSATKPDTYFQYREHSALMFAHIALMTIGWLFCTADQRDVLNLSITVQSSDTVRFPSCQRDRYLTGHNL